MDKIKRDTRIVEMLANEDMYIIGKASKRDKRNGAKRDRQSAKAEMRLYK